VLEELELTDDRGLRCCRCHRQFWSTPKTRDAILEATLRHDAACRGCALENSPDPDGCRGSAVFLNFFRNRVLLLERLDLDLEDYLRWTRDELPPNRRQAARQAFEEHRRLLRERRGGLTGPSVQKIFDLKRVADLFSDILAGVEYLHSHGVAHLDLKLANICVRFRGADLEVKLIDLGLSDDPDTLVYLRQAEGPLSLWTDFSAPEFRRPRGHRLAVDARFREDACELEWPCPEGQTSEQPYAGDVLFFEDRDLIQQRWRVVYVRPGRTGWLLVHAVTEPRHLPWLGEGRMLPPFGPEARPRKGLEVVLEKHCGFPADVFSLGMLLVAVLVGRPDIGDFRDALPSVQIELEDHLHDWSELPSRALVQRLQSKPSKHLQVFHTYAHRLAAYGVSQPLAEELLGVALRATLRGDPRLFYLTDRGADARPALRRLRADLDAVRGAVTNALTSAQAAAVRQERLAVLDRLRGRLQKRQTHAGPPSHPDPACRLLFPALDLGAAGDSHCASELAYLSPLARQPGSVLERWERELSTPERDGSTAGRLWDFLLRYCRVVDLNAPVAAAFLHAYHDLTERILQSTVPGDPAHGEDRERVRRWADDYQSLAERLECGPKLVACYQTFVHTLRDKLLRPWDRALRGRRLFLFRRQSVRVPLSRAERSAIRSDELGAALERLEAAVRDGVTGRKRRAADFEGALARWRVSFAGCSWLDALARLESDALRQQRDLEAASDAWDQGWTEAADRLRDWLAKMNALLSSYEQLLSTNPFVEEVSARLTRMQREAVEPTVCGEAVLWFERNWPSPSEKVEAVFALLELGLADS
jgi:hypothetical protein